MKAGRLDGFWEENLSAWDIAAGVILIREAGGFISGMNGDTDFLEGGAIIAGNEHIHKALIDVANRPIPKA